MADVNKDNNFKLKSKSSFFKRVREEITTDNNQTKKEECFALHDVNSDGYLDVEEVELLLRGLLCCDDQESLLTADLVTKIFNLIDVKRTGLIDQHTFSIWWEKWIKLILRPVTALLIIDVQNDFISGSLALHACPARHDGGAVVPVINEMLDAAKFDLVVYSCDWHPPNHISFIDCVKQRDFHHTSQVSSDKAQIYDTVVFSTPRVTEQQLWPAHCVQETWGAQLHDDLKRVENSIVINKGTNPDIDSYSAFWDNQKLAKTDLDRELEKRQVTDVFVCGLAYDICVGYTAMHALEHGLRTVIVDDACRGVNTDNIDKLKKKFIEGHGVIVGSDQVVEMLRGRRRDPRLAYAAALNLAASLARHSDERDGPS